MSWVFDAASGVYKNHSLSDQIRRQALADTILMQFTRPEPGFGKKKGDTHTITRILQLNPATRVSETSRLPSGRPVIQTRSIVVSEWGFKMELTELEKNLTHYDIQNQFQLMLKDQMAITMDNMVAEADKATPWRMVLTGTDVAPTYSFTTNGVFGATAPASGRSFIVSDLRRIYKEFRDRAIPFFKGRRYAAVLSTAGIASIKEDDEYRNWLSPTSSKEFREGQVADIEGFMIMESNNGIALDPTAGSTTSVGEGLFFGADATAVIEVDTPDIRIGAVADDLGRFREVGWVGTVEAGLVWETGALSRVLYMGSL
jgi:N4-gp56 family major capsid protein